MFKARYRLYEQNSLRLKVQIQSSISVTEFETQKKCKDTSVLYMLSHFSIVALCLKHPVLPGHRIVITRLVVSPILVMLHNVTYTSLVSFDYKILAQETRQGLYIVIRPNLGPDHCI